MPLFCFLGLRKGSNNLTLFFRLIAINTVF